MCASQRANTKVTKINVRSAHTHSKLTEKYSPSEYSYKKSCNYPLRELRPIKFRRASFTKKLAETNTGPLIHVSVTPLKNPAQPSNLTIDRMTCNSFGCSFGYTCIRRRITSRG